MVVTTFDLILAARFKKIKTCSFSFLFMPILFFTCVLCSPTSESFQKHLALVLYEQKGTKQGTKKLIIGQTKINNLIQLLYYNTII